LERFAQALLWHFWGTAKMSFCEMACSSSMMIFIFHWVFIACFMRCLIARHEHTLDEIMKIVGVSGRTDFTYRDTMVEKGGLVCSTARGWERGNQRLGVL
jgi:hypothetical protein